MKKIRNILTLALSGLFLAGFLLAAILTPDRTDSLSERRKLAQRPALRASAVADGTYMTAFEKYAEVFAQNDDLIGWISIPGTRIDYPVMQTKDDPDFYLKHAFDKSYSNYGVPYAAENCDADISDNMVLYGHHMNNGSMFSDLCKYEDEDFYREHKTIYFDTLGGYGEYEVIAAFKTVAYSESGFQYYHFVNAESEAAFDEYVAKCKELSLYDTGASAAYGDKLITLSTCEYSQTNGRMVVVAKKISSPPVEVDRNEA